MCSNCRAVCSIIICGHCKFAKYANAHFVIVCMWMCVSGTQFAELQTQTLFCFDLFVFTFRYLWMFYLICFWIFVVLFTHNNLKCFISDFKFSNKNKQGQFLKKKITTVLAGLTYYLMHSTPIICENYHWHNRKL